MSIINAITFGTVDWYGGENKKNGRRNHFGFITTYDLVSVFVHKDELANGSVAEGDAVAFAVEKDSSGKIRAKGVVRLVAGDSTSRDALIKLCMDDKLLTHATSNTILNKEIVKQLESDAGEQIIEKLKRKKSRRLILVSVLKKCRNQAKLFTCLMSGLSTKELFNSGISASEIPNEYLIENYDRLYRYWRSLPNSQLKFDVLTKSVSKLARSSKLYSDLLALQSEQQWFDMISEINSEFGILPQIVNLLNKNADTKPFLEHYVSTPSFDDLIKNDFPLHILPKIAVREVLTNKLHSIDNSKDYCTITPGLFKLLLKFDLIEYATFDVSKDMQSALFSSGIFADEMPDKYFTENNEKLYRYWQSLPNSQLKFGVLSKSVNKLINSSQLYNDLLAIIPEQILFNIITEIKSEFGTVAPIVNLLGKKTETKRLLEHYISDLSYEDLVKNDLPLRILPKVVVEDILIKQLHYIEVSKDYSTLTQDLLKLLIAFDLLEYATFEMSDDIKLILVKHASGKLPDDKSIFKAICKSVRGKELMNVYFGQKDLTSFLERGISIELLPIEYVKEQVQVAMQRLENPKKSAKSVVNGLLIRAALKISELRLKAIHLIKKAHITNYFDIIQCLTNHDHIVIQDLLVRALKQPISSDEMPHVIPLLLIDDLTFVKDFYANNVVLILTWVSQLSDSERQQFYHQYLQQLDTSALLSLVFKGIIDANTLGARIGEIDKFVFDMLCKNDTGVQPYVRTVYRQCFCDLSDFTNNAVIKPLYKSNNLLLRKHSARFKAYKRDLSFAIDIDNDEELVSDPEFWMLSKLIPLLNAENSYENIASVIFHEIWVALLNGTLDVNHPSIFKLFPQCEALKNEYPHMTLSCEAFFWKKEKDLSANKAEYIYLCRSRRCHDPKVVPDTNKHIDNFSVFDWLSFYGANYAAPNEPSKHDFAIKLSGYLNRIRELHAKLHCRSCGVLMVPDMKYARVEIIKIDPSTGMKVKIPVNAAYRLTVFKCNCKECSLFNVKYYINHCLGFNCYEIIDSRDNKDKCSEGRYICENPDCMSCCPVHSEKKPVGLQDNLGWKHKQLYGSLPNFNKLKKG
ncbi:MAG: hypothetical protein COA76_12005 [Moritella sp.]|nr:MAG: hypothetical protein COA76_12005 [Moritella sp.]